MEILELPSCGIESKVRGATTGEEGAESEMVDAERGEGDDEEGVIGAISTAKSWSVCISSKLSSVLVLLFLPTPRPPRILLVFLGERI